MIVVLGGRTKGNRRLVEGLRALGLAVQLAPAREARARGRESGVVIARPDVRASLDGIEDGLLELLWLERSGVRVLNSVRALLAVHDKLRTARALAEAGLPHPRTRRVADERELAAVELPVVVKPRFGSWGRDVIRCRDERELRACVEEIRTRRWFRRHGALVQELLPFRDRDLRVIVADRAAVGAAERLAAPGEWRTNVSLGGRHQAVELPQDARALAVDAAVATGIDLVGVDLYRGERGWVVLELNGAVEFDEVYSLPGTDVYAEIADALALGRPARVEAARPAR